MADLTAFDDEFVDVADAPAGGDEAPAPDAAKVPAGSDSGSGSGAAASAATSSAAPAAVAGAKIDDVGGVIEEISTGPQRKFLNCTGEPLRLFAYGLSDAAPAESLCVLEHDVVSKRSSKDANATAGEDEVWMVRSGSEEVVNLTVNADLAQVVCVVGVDELSPFNSSGDGAGAGAGAGAGEASGPTFTFSNQMAVPVVLTAQLKGDLTGEEGAVQVIPPSLFFTLPVVKGEISKATFRVRYIESSDPSAGRLVLELTGSGEQLHVILGKPEDAMAGAARMEVIGKAATSGEVDVDKVLEKHAADVD